MEVVRRWQPYQSTEVIVIMLLLIQEVVRVSPIFNATQVAATELMVMEARYVMKDELYRLNLDKVVRAMTVVMLDKE